MTGAATMFLTGPAVVAEVMGEQLSAAELGGPRVHDRNGVSHFTAATDVDAALLVRDLRRLAMPTTPPKRTEAKT